MKFQALLAHFLCFSLLCSCGLGFGPGYISLGGRAEFGPEREFLEGIFAEPGFLDTLGLELLTETGDDRPDTTEKGRMAPGRIPVPAISIDFHESWAEGEGILISKTWMLPREDILAGRTGAELADCLAGKETLVPIGEIGPPYIGLPVDGMIAADEGYPLVRHVYVTIGAVENGGGRAQKRVAQEITALEMKLREAPKPLVNGAPQIVWISSAGDLMLGRGSGEILIREGPAGIFGGIAEHLAAADLTLINLEGPVSGRGARIEKAFNFRFDPLTVPALKAAGIDAVLLANNHVFDFGKTAFLDTLSHLEAADIGALGAGADIEAAAKPFTFSAKGLEIQVFGIASFPRERSGWDGSSAAAAADQPGMLFAGKGGAERLKAELGGDGGPASAAELGGDGGPGVDNGLGMDAAASLKVLLFHGGNEWTLGPDAETRRLYTELVKSGADLVIGSHPHVVQGFEWIEGKPVFWSLGNFVFAGMGGTFGGEEGLLVRLGYLKKTLIYFEPVPVKLSGPRSDIGPASQLESFYRLSRELRADKAQ